MGSLKALQQWCRIQCENYNDVDVKDMSSSFRDGLAFCAIIHRFRPELIDFGSLSKENVYENNRLAFEVAESQLGIPALLDPEDMVSMKVPDRLSVITYVSQYYNFFNNKSQANPPSMKRLSTVGLSEPVQKRPATPLEDSGVTAEPGPPTQTDAADKRSTLSSTCAACQKHVHLVQRFLVDGKLYHRNCFRCTECHSTLLPGSYRLGVVSGALVCKHHAARSTSDSPNGRPDLSKRPPVVQSARIGRTGAPHTPIALEHERVNNSNEPEANAAVADDSLEIREEVGGEMREISDSATPRNPFDESDDEEDDEEEETKEEEELPAQLTANGELSPPAPTPATHQEGAIRPVPAPRRVEEPSPPPRPAPRIRLLRTIDGDNQKPPTPPKPRERSQSPGSLSTGTHKPKDPPWLSLVQSEPKKKKAPAPPPAVQATPPNAGSLSSFKGGGSRPGTPPPLQPPVPANPFADDDDDDGERSEAEEDVAGVVPTTVTASHPWYSITRPTETPGGDTPPSAGSSSRSASPGATKSKKRRAPRAPQLPPGGQALSIESLSSSSDHSSSLASQAQDQPPAFTKSVSEPSICSPSDAATSPPSSSEPLPRSSLGPTPAAAPPPIATSAPATPQAVRSRENGASPPQPSPLVSGAVQFNNKRTCKENPFNRKASPSPAKSKSKSKPLKGPRPARPPAPGHGFPLIKRKVQSDEYIPVEDIHGEMSGLERQLDELEQRGVELEKKLRDNPNDEDEEHLLVDWFTLIHEKHLLVRREAELVYTAKQQNLEERQADVEYELRCLLNKPEKDWTDEDKSREQELMAELVTIIEQRNQIVNSMDQDRQRDEEEDKLIGAMLKKKDFQKESEGEEQPKKKGGKFKPIKALKRLSHKGEPSKSPRKDKTQ